MSFIHPIVPIKGVKVLDIYTSSYLFHNGYYDKDIYGIKGKNYWNNLCPYCKGVFKYSDLDLRRGHYERCFKYSRLYSDSDTINYSDQLR